MSKRKYTHVKLLEPEILEMRASGKTKREIAEHFGLTTEQVKELLKRYRRKERKISVGITLSTSRVVDDGYDTSIKPPISTGL